MSRYIDYDALDYKNWHMIGKSSDFIDGVVYMAERIEEAPSVDLADYVPKDFHDKTCEAMVKRHTEEIQRLMPKHGEWKPFDLKWGRSIWCCTACEESTEVPCDIWEHKPIYKYCPNCGADMRKESE